jgi:hypothetical protein
LLVIPDSIKKTDTRKAAVAAAENAEKAAKLLQEVRNAQNQYVPEDLPRTKDPVTGCRFEVLESLDPNAVSCVQAKRRKPRCDEFLTSMSFLEQKQMSSQPPCELHCERSRAVDHSLSLLICRLVNISLSQLFVVY